MWQYAGLVRDGEGLRTAMRVLDDLQNRYGQAMPTRESIELVNMITSARLVTRAALEREESRGAHFRTDFPVTDDAHWQHHILLRCDKGELKVEHAAIG
jgi:L-aspartate oxidase